MTDRLDFETRLEARLRARAALASRPFDAGAIARQAVAVGGRRRSLGRLPWPSMRPALGWLVLLLLAVAVLGAVATIGAFLREPSIVPSGVVSNGLIAVSANPNDVGGGEVGDIYLVGDSAAARRIIGSKDDGIAQACPRFSPDGQRLAYGEARASGPVTTFRGRWPVTDRAVVVVVVNDLGDPSPPSMRAIAAADGGPIPCPEWSPDGTHVAFRVGSELRVADAASGETMIVPISAESGWEQNEFEWSRDGSRIAVAEPGQIRLVHVDGGSSTVIPVNGATPASLGWTGGDDRIVYLSTDPPGDGQAVHIVGANGTNDMQLVPDPSDSVDPQAYLGVADAVVSPDGRRVAYASHVIRCTSDGCSWDPEHILTMDLDGSNVIEVPIRQGFGVPGLQWSPDGQRLLFGSMNGVTSVAVAPGSPDVVHSSGELNLEWSSTEVTWQPVFR